MKHEIVVGHSDDCLYVECSCGETLIETYLPKLLFKDIGKMVMDHWNSNVEFPAQPIPPEPIYHGSCNPVSPFRYPPR